MEKEVCGSNPGLAATISEIGYLLLPSRDMAQRSLKRRKNQNNQPTETAQPILTYFDIKQVLNVLYQVLFAKC